MLIGLNRTSEGRFALLSRYQYPSAVFILIVAAELLRGVRIPRSAAAVTVVVTVAALIGGFSLMDSHYESGRRTSVQIRLTTSALDIAGSNAVPDRRISFPPAVTIPAVRYLRAAEQHGSPAYTEEELFDGPEANRESMDAMLAEFMGIELGSCERRAEAITVPPGPAGGLGWRGSRRPRRVHHRQHRSFGSGIGPWSVCRRSPHRTRARALRVPRAPLTIPPDRSDRRWRIAATGRPVLLCPRARARRCQLQGEEGGLADRRAVGRSECEVRLHAQLCRSSEASPSS